MDSETFTGLLFKQLCFKLTYICSLIKMLYWMCKKSGGLPLTWPQMKHAIMRNFGGLKSEELDPFKEFCKQLNIAEEQPNSDDYGDVKEVAIYILYHCPYIIFILDMVSH